MQTIIDDKVDRQFVPVSAAAIQSPRIQRNTSLACDCDGDCGQGDCDCPSDCSDDD